MATDTDDRIVRWLSRRGCAIAHCAPHAGHALPDPRRFDFVVVYGGPQSVLQRLSFLEQETAFVRARVDAGLPLLGICLGAQLLASALGARVARLAGGSVELGYRTVQPVPARDSPFHAPLTVFQWHEDGFELPAGAEHLASSPACAVEAFRVSQQIIGLQFHPEADSSTIRRWQQDAPQHLERPGADSPETIERDGERHEPAIERWLDGFLERWVGPP